MTSRSASTSPCRRMRPSRREVSEAMSRTHRWAERCLEAHRRAGPGALRHHPGRPRGGSPHGLHADHQRPALRRPVHRRAGRGRDAGAATRRARRRRAAARRRPAAALPHGPRVASWTSSTPSTPASTCSTRCCPRGWPATARCGSPEGRLNLRNARFLDDPAARPGGLPRAASAGPSRAPTWRTSSGPASCSPTGSRLVTT